MAKDFGFRVRLTIERGDGTELMRGAVTHDEIDANETDGLLAVLAQTRGTITGLLLRLQHEDVDGLEWRPTVPATPDEAQARIDRTAIEHLGWWMDRNQSAVIDKVSVRRLLGLDRKRD